MILLVLLAFTLGFSGERQIMDHPIHGAMLSPDGKSFAFTDHNALYVRDLETYKDKQILPSAPLGLWLNWTPDSKMVYFLRPDPAVPMWTDLYRITLETGEIEKVLSHVSSYRPSPDGKHLLCSGGFGATLVLTDANGKNERKLPSGLFFAPLAWAADGSHIVFQLPPKGSGRHAVLPQWEATTANFILYDIATGEHKPLLDLKKPIAWFTWPAGASGMYFLLDKQVWHYSIPGGEMTQITHDPDGYAAFHGASADGLSIAVERNNPPPEFWDNLLGLMGMRRTLYDPPLKMVLIRVTR